MKTNKLVILFAIAFATLSLNSCKKDSKDAIVSNTISASIDGTVTNFGSAFAVTATESGQKLTNIEGVSSNKATISITLSGTITAGKTYTSTAANDDDKPLILYSTVDGDNYLNDDNSANIVTVKVTAVSATNIQGTFTGGLTTFSIGNGAAKTKAVTNGKFNVTFKQ